MTVPSPEFLVFAAIAAILVNLGLLAGLRGVVMLAVNLVFIASFSHDPIAFLPFAGFLTLGYVAQRVCRNGSKGRLFTALLLVTIAAFFWLKRYTFIPHAAFLPYPYVIVGLSYVFFRVLHLIIDSHQGDIEQDVSILSYLNYTLNFTSLTSGPIQRYQDYRQSEVERFPLGVAIAGRAFERIAIGYFKVGIISMALSTLQHQQIDDLASVHGLVGRIEAAFVIVGVYPIYLYFNFSGYTDVVIGVARFLRIVLPENFDRPFSSENFIIFWSRWHITLSNWLKTYVYNPLMLAMMERVTAPALSPYLAVAAFFVTFFLVGLWHGQTSEFLFFGLLQGGGVAANKLYQVLAAQVLGRQGYRALCAAPVYRMVCRGLTFTWFGFTLLWFWSSWGQIGGFLATLGPAATSLALLAIFLAATIVLAILEAVRSLALKIDWSVDPGVREPIIRSRYVRTAWATALVLITTVVIVLLGSPAPDVVYKTF